MNPIRIKTIIEVMTDCYKVTATDKKVFHVDLLTKEVYESDGEKDKYVCNDTKVFLTAKVLQYKAKIMLESLNN